MTAGINVGAHLQSRLASHTQENDLDHCRGPRFRHPATVTVFEVAHPFLRFILRQAIQLPHPAHELVALAAAYFERIVGELSPLLPDHALELLPLALDAMPVHLRVPPLIH